MWRKIGIGIAVVLILWAVSDPSSAGGFVKTVFDGGKEALGQLAIFLKQVFS